MVEPGLGDAVGAEPAVGVAGGDRRDADERPASAAHHLPGAVLEHVHAAVDVQVDRAPPGVGVHLGERADGQRSAGAVHGAVQPAVPCRRGLDGAGDLVLVGDVGGLVADRAAARLDRVDLLDGRREPVGVAADDHDRGTGGDQAGGNALADPAATTGDQVRPVFERKLHADPFAPKLKQVLAIEPCARSARTTATRECPCGRSSSASGCANPRHPAAARRGTGSRCARPSARAPARECGRHAATPR